MNAQAVLCRQVQDSKAKAFKAIGVMEWSCLESTRSRKGNVSFSSRVSEAQLLPAGTRTALTMLQFTPLLPMEPREDDCKSRTALQ